MMVLALLSDIAKTAIAALIALFVKDYLDRRSASGKYEKTDIETVVKQVDEIRSRAVIYWSSDAADADALVEAEIIGMLHGVAVMVGSFVGLDTHSKQELRECLSMFRRVCTGGNFQTLNREREIDRLERIELEARYLMAKLLSCRRR